MTNSHNKKFNKKLSRTLSLLLITSILITIALLSLLFFTQTKKILISSLGDKALHISKISAEKINIDEYKNFKTPKDMEKSYYIALGKELNEIREISGAKYLYIMNQNENDDFVYILESSDYSSDDPTVIGEVEENFYEGFSIAMKGNPYIDDYISVDEYGALISAYYPLKDTNNEVIGFVGVDYGVDNAHSSFKNFEKLILFLSVGLGIFVTIIGYLISKNISKPLREAAKISEKIANYDLDTHKIHIKNKDEVGLLANSINIMINNLRDIVENVKNNSIIIKDSTHSLNIMTDESSQAVENITSSINEIAIGSENTSTNILELNNLVTNFSASLQQTAANTNEANQVSFQMKNSAAKGQESVENIITKVNLINESTENTSAVIEDLNNKVKNINEIIQVINNISEQTNLLALNANIEAARAGDAGKGFAVVAEEVRKLAEETQGYSNEISSMISSITNSTKDAVNSMSSVKSIVKDSIDTAYFSKEVFDNLLQKINKTSELVDDISKASEEQASNTDTIMEMINEVSAISEQTTSTCQNSAASAEETLSSIEEITSLTENLSTIASSLNDLASKFKL